MNTGTNNLRPTVTAINSVMFARTAISADTAGYVQKTITYNNEM